MTDAKRYILNYDLLNKYVKEFNCYDEELYVNAIPNNNSAIFLKNNIPLFECPDKDIEKTYYFRWWTYRKHIKNTEDGYVITEFLSEVEWSGKHNTISCAAAQHIYEGRWLYDSSYIDDYLHFWLRKRGAVSGLLPGYSFPIADALYNRFLVDGDNGLPEDLLPELIENYKCWEKFNLKSDGLFWQDDGKDGMELSISGSGKRPTINSYMYADAKAISAIASIAGKESIIQEYSEKAKCLQALVQDKLWDKTASFFKVIPGLGKGDSIAGVRELLGYIPWCYNLPEKEKGYERAWKQLMDPNGFYAPFGPTTAEQRHPGFTISYDGHECQWNGPSWPLATSQTLTALANVLTNYTQEYVSKEDYFATLKCYSNAHLFRESFDTTGEVGQTENKPWIDENLNPYTGDWISRSRLKVWNNETWSKGKGGRERGKDYNHSTYVDLIISGLIGLRPRGDDVVEINPLLPADTWDYYCMDSIRYHGHILTILWDKTGKRYGKGKGQRLFLDGKLIASSKTLEKISGVLK